MDSAPKSISFPETDGGVSPAPDWVEYDSRGEVLVCGPAFLAIPAGALLAKSLRVVVCATGNVSQTSLKSNPMVMLARITKIRGYLGRFKVEAAAGVDKEADLGPFSGNPDGCFDLVLDLNAFPLLESSIKPLGYQAPGPDPKAIAAAIAYQVRLTGTFRKRRNFHFDSARCAHTAQGLQGCTRCLDTCPAGALRSSGNKIEIDPYLCQGCATCMLACPTGALGPAGDSVKAIQHLGGIEAWLGALVDGSPKVVIEVPPTLPPETRRELARQARLARALLRAIGKKVLRITFAESSRLASTDSSGHSDPRPFSTSPSGMKHASIHASLTHLQAKGNNSWNDLGMAEKLPEGSPFGMVAIESSSCTLCKACINVCPTGALLSNTEDLSVKFIEARCVQCHLCRRVCPERAISLAPRLLRAPDARNQAQLLHEDMRHFCPGCDTPFTGRALLQKTVRTLSAKGILSPEGLTHLHYCPACRVQRLGSLPSPNGQH